MGGVLTLASCGDKQPARVLAAHADSTVFRVSKEKLLGTYTGDFRGSPISINLRYLSINRVSGYNVHKGLKRNLTGTITPLNGKLRLLLSEPGTNPYDGTIDLLLDTATGQASGVWTPMKKGDPVRFGVVKQKVMEEGEGQVMYSTYYDSTQNEIELRRDGSCTYKLMIQDSLQAKQQVTLRGSYKVVKDSMVIVYWQSNNVLSAKQTTFQWYRLPSEDASYEEEYRLYGLKGVLGDFTQSYD
jgi:hypothetical protein